MSSHHITCQIRCHVLPASHCLHLCFSLPSYPVFFYVFLSSCLHGFSHYSVPPLSATTPKDLLVHIGLAGILSGSMPRLSHMYSPDANCFTVCGFSCVSGACREAVKAASHVYLSKRAKANVNTPFICVRPMKSLACL